MSASRRNEEISRSENAYGQVLTSWRPMVDCFLDGGQGLLPAAQVEQADGPVVQRPGEVGEEGVGGLRS